MFKLDNQNFILSDGIPTILKSLDYVKNICYAGKIKITTIKPKHLIVDYLDSENIDDINIFKFRFKLNELLKEAKIIFFSNNFSCPSSYLFIKHIIKKNLTF